VWLLQWSELTFFSILHGSSTWKMCFSNTQTVKVVVHTSFLVLRGAPHECCSCRLLWEGGGTLYWTSTGEGSTNLAILCWYPSTEGIHTTFGLLHGTQKKKWGDIGVNYFLGWQAIWVRIWWGYLAKKHAFGKKKWVVPCQICYLWCNIHANY